MLSIYPNLWKEPWERMDDPRHEKTFWVHLLPVQNPTCETQCFQPLNYRILKHVKDRLVHLPHWAGEHIRTPETDMASVEHLKQKDGDKMCVFYFHLECFNTQSHIYLPTNLLSFKKENMVGSRMGNSNTLRNRSKLFTSKLSHWLTNSGRITCLAAFLPPNP